MFEADLAGFADQVFRDVDDVASRLFGKAGQRGPGSLGLDIPQRRRSMKRA